MSTVVSKPGQLPLCTMQSPAPAALVHALVNFASHFVSFAGSGGRPFENPLAITPHLQATFLPIAFVTPPSHFEAASALPAAPVRKSTATAIDSLRMFSILPISLAKPQVDAPSSNSVLIVKHFLLRGLLPGPDPGGGS